MSRGPGIQKEGGVAGGGAVDEGDYKSRAMF